jgi:hypothetical protein
LTAVLEVVEYRKGANHVAEDEKVTAVVGVENDDDGQVRADERMVIVLDTELRAVDASDIIVRRAVENTNEGLGSVKEMLDC